VLGDLAVAGRLELYRGCTTLLQTSDRAGTGAEEIIRSLPAGTYAVRTSGSGSSSTPAYALLMKRMPNSVHVVSSRARIEGNTLRLVGEVYNNASTTTRSVVVTARMYNAANMLIATRSVGVDLSYVPVGGRSPFRIVGPLPTGYDHVSWSVSAQATSRRIGAPVRTILSSGLNAAGRWAMTGAIRNAYRTTVTALRVTVTLYDSRGNVLDATRATVGRITLGAGASTSMSATFLPTGLAPDRVYVQGMVFR